MISADGQVVAFASYASDLASTDTNNDLDIFVRGLTPRQRIEGLIEKVKTLVAAGVLNQGQGNGLIAKLEAAIQQLEPGNTKTAINHLQALVNQMSAFIKSGTVPSAQGQPLIDVAQQIIAALGG